MFDFEKETKEKYYRRAERILEDNEIDFLVVDRDQITLYKGDQLKIHMIPWRQGDVDKHMLARIRKCPGFVITWDRYKKKRIFEEGRLFETGYMILPLDAKDR